jgi:15-cis-phytoene desaturase
MPKTVIIAGAGVAGLSAAHELAKYPALFDVHVYEKNDHCGGKCASQDAPVKNVSGHHLGEHGFRFFPWFYRHIAETLREIPLSGVRVFDALEESNEAGIAVGGDVYRVPRGTKSMLQIDFLKIMELTFNKLKVSPADLVTLAAHYLKFHLSCHDRRNRVYEYLSWAEFLETSTPGKYAPHFARLMNSVPMMLVAMQASKGSARTLGNVGIQMLYDFDTASYDKVDPALQGPTSITWIEPWVTDLKAKGVKIDTGYELVGIDLAPAVPFKPRHVQSVGFRDPSGTLVPIDVSKAYFICAVPLDRVGALLTPALIAADPALASLDLLVNSATKPWGNMIGVQYYLDVDPTMLKGHVAYPESDWALTSISQAQYWRAGGYVDPDLSKQFGIPNLKGVISVIACHWNVKSSVLNKTAQQCTEAEVKAEIWRQLVESAYPDPTKAPVPLDSHLDENVTMPPPSGSFQNLTPLLIHPPGSYPMRPPAGLKQIDNLMLASDYVQTNTELATMEGANEAAKRAVSAIYDAELLTMPRPGIYELPEDSASDWIREFDCWLFAHGWPHLMNLAIGSQLLFSLEEIPAKADTFVFDEELRSAVRVSAHSPEGLAHLRRYPPPLFLVPGASVVYAGFPHPEQLPGSLDPKAVRSYRQFWKNRERLVHFLDEPTAEDYRLWEGVMNGALEA